MLTAPAKLNLGLEILGKRADGFHEIRTLMAMLEFGDTLTVSRSGRSAVQGVPGVQPDANLVGRALSAFKHRSGSSIEVDISVSKRIPMAAGLGGASADAAATLIALNALIDVPLIDSHLHEIAASLGSDVPFFLGSPLAHSSGTGTSLSPLQPVSFDAILVVPKVTIPRKTATLYGLLEPSDFSEGSLIEHGVQALVRTGVPDQQSLGNAFERPLYALVPELSQLRQALETVECAAIGLSGAGPAHYVVPSLGSVRETELALRALLPPDVQVVSTRSRITDLRADVIGQTEPQA